MKIKFILLIGIIIYLTSCSNVLSKIEKNASIVIINYSFNSSVEVIEPSVTIYLKNIDTKDETRMRFGKHRMDLSSSNPKSVVINLQAGSYEFSRWEYDACKKMDKFQLFCKEWYSFKGKSTKLKQTKFRIKQGEILYLGHIKLDINEATLNQYKSSNNFKFGDREVNNISNSITIDDWQFEMTGYKSLFDFIDGIKESFK